MRICYESYIICLKLIKSAHKPPEAVFLMLNYKKYGKT